MILLQIEMIYFRSDQGGNRERTGASVPSGCEDRSQVANAEMIKRNHFQLSKWSF